MAVKFSAFTTRTGTLDASTRIVGYDDPAGTKTNVEFTLATLVDNVPNIYNSDGTLSGNRTITVPTSGSITFSTTSGGFNFYIGSNYISSLGEIRVPSAGRFKINSYNTELTQNHVKLYATSYITGTTTGFVTVSGTTGTSYSIDARLGVVGTTNDNTSYAFRVQNSDSTDIFHVSNDTTTTVEKNLVVKGQGYTEFYDTANTTLTVDWNNSNIQELTSLTGSLTFTASNPKAGATYILTLAQTGTVTATWTGVKWPAATAPILSGAGKTDVVTLICYDATGAGLYYGASTLNFTT
jgi:hypothetical protein